MRLRDEEKYKAICEAAVHLVNEIGFAAASVSKIAKQAQVSPATIYIYFENKEDLLVSTYVNIKKKMSQALLDDFDDTQPIRDILKNTWRQMFAHVAQHREQFYFTEQFASSPFADLVDKSKVEKYFEPLFVVLQRGIEQKIIKNVKFDILGAFAFYPILTLSNPRLCHHFDLTDSEIGTAFDMAWDAIKL